MTNQAGNAAEPQIRPFGKLRKGGGKPPGTTTTTLYLPNSLNSRIVAQAALRQMHRQELLGRLLEKVFPESPTLTKVVIDLAHPDLVVLS